MDSGAQGPAEEGRGSLDAARQRGKRELQKLGKAELYQRATELEVPGRSKMSREDLIDALARAGRRRKKSTACWSAC
ncbi:Rho termination factor N-terminal domain-containing protein [Streptomyces collinus]|uniref:Rho termination factor N-terminal domain-containing protein n=1 Tax=Streptomyces collinus TaxID=42684 RepID=UPI00340819B7